MILGDAVSKLEAFVWILNHISRFIAWSLFTLKTCVRSQQAVIYNMADFVEER